MKVKLVTKDGFIRIEDISKTLFNSGIVRVVMPRPVSTISEVLGVTPCQNPMDNTRTFYRTNEFTDEGLVIFIER